MTDFIIGSRYLALCLGLVVLVACSSQPGRQQAMADFPLLPPASLGAPASAFLQIDMAMGERHQLLHMAIEVTANHLQLVVMDTLGRRLATLSSSGDGYQLKREPGAPRNIDYRQLLAALQITFWPLETLNSELGPAGWQFVQRRERGAWYYGELAARVSSEETAAWTGRYQLFFPRDGFHWNLQSVLLP